MQHRKWTTAASAALVLVSAIGLAGCGDDSEAGSNQAEKAPNSAGTSAAADTYNDADVTFASHMILHHQQAIQMSGMAGWQAKNPQVKQLATAITTTYGTHKQQMSAWLTRWGKAVPAPSHGDHTAEESIPGMLTEDELHDLGKADGTRFDRVWIAMMIRHHQGAVTMAKAVQTDGESPETIKLAETIIADQSAQVGTLKRLQARLPAA